MSAMIPPEHNSESGEESFRLIVETIPGLIAVMTAGGDVAHVNQRVLDYFGRTLEELKKWGTTDAVHPVDLSDVVAAWQHAVERGSPYEVEHRLRRADGEYRWFQSRGQPLREANGRVVRWYNLLTDIHDRKQAEDRLRQGIVALKRAEEKIRAKEAEWRQMLEFTPQLVRVFGPNHERIYANRIGLEYLGVTLEEWRQVRDMCAFVHPDDADRMRSCFDRARSIGAAFELEVRLRRADGSHRWFLIRYNPLRNNQGQIARWHVGGTDIEDRKQAEDRVQRENVALREEIDKASMFEEIVGASPALQSVLSYISKVAPSDSTVLITGETGTGKELVARAIHKKSRRRSRPFVSVNCAAIPAPLVASELFGHEKGAFTGALQRRLGRFELAEGGTIFLDEVGELPPETQIALLRVLQEREFERVGGNKSIRADVRVIAATNRDLQTAIASAAFRSDLFYRLNVFPIHIPSLRERKEDISVLVEYFIARFARNAGKTIRGIDQETLELLQSYPWPGNIRELQNVIERSVIVSETENFFVDKSWLASEFNGPQREARQLAKKTVTQEKEMIQAALRESKGRVSGSSGAAAKLGIPASTLESKIRSLKIDKYRFKSA